MVGSELPVVDLPRTQSGARPQHLLLTLLGDYWYGRDEHLPSAALVRLLAEFDVTPVGARAALSRLARRGLLESSRQGRRTYYGLTPAAAQVLTEGVRRILTFGLTSAEWTGEWTVAAFSLPERQRDQRHVLRTRLRWLGLAPLYDGMWVAPGTRAAEPATAVFAELGVVHGTVFTAAVLPGGPAGGDPIGAWDLDRLRGQYDEFVERYAPLRRRAAAGEVAAAEALVARTAIMDDWRNFPNLDPELPDALLPRPWPRRAAREVFAGVYDDLAPLAEARVREVLGEFAPGLGALARHHTTEYLDSVTPAAASRR